MDTMKKPFKAGEVVMFVKPDDLFDFCHLRPGHVTTIWEIGLDGEFVFVQLQNSRSTPLQAKCFIRACSLAKVLYRTDDKN